MIKTDSTDYDFHCLLTNGKLIIDSDAPPFKGGLGNGFRPHEFLEAALASCISITIRMIAKENHIKLKSISTQVELERTDILATFRYKITLDEDLKGTDRQLLMNIIDSCAVKQTLCKEFKFEQYD